MTRNVQLRSTLQILLKFSHQLKHYCLYIQEKIRDFVDVGFLFNAEFPETPK